MEQFTELVLHSTFTKEAVFRRLGLLREYCEAVTYESANETPSSVHEYFSSDGGQPDVTAVARWVEALPAEFMKTFYQDIEATEQAVEDVAVVVMYLPVTVSDVQKEELGRHVRTVVSDLVMTRFQIDPRAVGGCCFVWNGTYYDFSLHHYMAAHADVMDSYFNTYARTTNT